jgi:hypothetical protein
VYSIVVMAALMSGGESSQFGRGWYGSYDCIGGYGSYGYYGCYGCYGWGGCYGCYGWGSCGGCCGVVTPGIPPGPTLTPAEQKKWFDYVTSLEDDERQEVMWLWNRADLGARRQLLAKIVEKLPPPEAAPPEKKIEKDKPLTEAEQEKWDAYVNKLTGEKKKTAMENWKKADLAGKRKLLEAIPKE